MLKSLMFRFNKFEMEMDLLMLLLQNYLKGSFYEANIFAVITIEI